MLLNFCGETSPVWQFAGYVVTIFKIIIPAILVILGIISLGKAVIAADDKEIKTAANGFIKKFIIAVVVFFIPTIISALFQFINFTGNAAAGSDTDYTTCVKCISSPTGDLCKSEVANATN